MLVVDYFNLLPISMKYPFLLAYQNATKSSGVGGKTKKTFRLGAVILKKNQKIAYGFNSYKTHPTLKKYTNFPYIHAETSAILLASRLNSCGIENSCKGCIIYILRIKRNGEIGFAKPCATCLYLLRLAGIKRVYYTDSILLYRQITL